MTPEEVAEYRRRLGVVASSATRRTAKEVAVLDKQVAAAHAAHPDWSRNQIAEHLDVTTSTLDGALRRLRRAGYNIHFSRRRLNAQNGRLTQQDMCSVGITYRQLDHWARQGWLCFDPGASGSGSVRTFPPSELDVVRLMAALTRAGLSPQAAHKVAHGEELAPGIRVEVAA